MKDKDKKNKIIKILTTATAATIAANGVAAFTDIDIKAGNIEENQLGKDSADYVMEVDTIETSEGLFDHIKNKYNLTEDQYSSDGALTNLANSSTKKSSENATANGVPYFKSNYTVEQQKILESSVVSMKNLNPSTEVVVPKQFEKLNNLLLDIIESGKYKDQKLYENFCTGMDCYLYAEFQSWFMDTYSYKIYQKFNFRGTTNDYYVHLDLEKMFEYNKGRKLPSEKINDDKIIDKYIEKTIEELEITKGTPTMDALWKIHNHLMDTLSYDKTLKYEWPAEGILTGKGTCNTYALLFKNLARRCGIDCDLLYCYSDNTTTTHVGNIVNFTDKKGGKFYMVIDTTRADTNSKGDHYFGMPFKKGLKSYYDNKYHFDSFVICDFENNKGSYAKTWYSIKNGEYPIYKYDAENNQYTVIKPNSENKNLSTNSTSNNSFTNLSSSHNAEINIINVKESIDEAELPGRYKEKNFSDTLDIMSL